MDTNDILNEKSPENSAEQSQAEGTRGPKTTILHTKTFRKHTDYTLFLQDLAKELSFSITFVDLEEKSNGSSFQCLVYLSTQPVAVCYGSALTFRGARVSAVKNALEYLKVMT